MSISFTIHEIYKSFANRRIIQNLSYTFSTGCYCVQGANGIGKTTLLNVFAGVEKQDSGTIYLKNVNVVNNTSLVFKKNLCYVPGKSSFFPATTGFDFLNFIRSIKDPNNQHSLQLNEIISEFKLEEYLITRFNEMSLGTQKKLFLTTMTIGANPLIILDEPTNGLDVYSNEVLVNLINHYKKTAIIIIVTHDNQFISNIEPISLVLQSSPIDSLRGKNE